jgi:cyclopropane fatty-acyl-phospholipid synthase-like methyltransferase
MTGESLSRRYFEKLYRAEPDPWRFATSDFEQAKYARTFEVLPRARYASALEVGCSIGVFTQLLAAKCDRLLAVDIATAPLAAARRRCADLRSVRFARMTVPKEWPAGRLDLIVLSEVVYYLSRDQVALLAQRIEHSLAEGGDVLLVHWTGATNYPLTGDEAAELLLGETSAFAPLIHRERTQAFRLDLLTRL